MKLILILLNSLMLLNLTAFGDTKEDYSFDILVNAKRLETARIYESGEISTQTKAFNVMLKGKTAITDFVKLFERSKNEAGKLYALTGLHELDHDKYKKFLKGLEMDKSVPALWFGVVQTKPIREWLEMIENGKMLDGMTWNPSK